MVKVTVVIAVYNPGKNIYELLWSLDAQSLPQDEFEVVFVDDDSTDGSREGLQRWAAKRPNAKVLHNTPNSGWPGRPRNLGIDAAVGEYLFFADNDDKFTPNALEWMYDYAVANDADVVIAKEAGVGPDRAVPRRIFRRNIADAKLGKDPVLALLTPHKLVRTSMIREHGIRFPEGRVRLEDHYFMVR
jgi:glycosyltransferase involved in cell wall biosynthesis